jgi:hypothetical protein
VLFSRRAVVAEWEPGMPVRLLTDAERGRFTGFPKEVPEEDLYAFFTLTGATASTSARTRATGKTGRTSTRSPARRAPYERKLLPGPDIVVKKY